MSEHDGITADGAWGMYERPVPPGKADPPPRSDGLADDRLAAMLRDADAAWRRSQADGTPPAAAALLGDLACHVRALAADLDRVTKLCGLAGAGRAGQTAVERVAELHAELGHQIDRAEARFKGALRELNDCEQYLAQAMAGHLGLPWYTDDPENFPDATEADGVCTGPHTAASLAAHAAEHVIDLEREAADLAAARDRLFWLALVPMWGGRVSVRLGRIDPVASWATEAEALEWLRTRAAELEAGDASTDH